MFDDPEMVDWFDTDDRGRATLGSRFANSKVKLAVIKQRSPEEKTDD